MIWTGVGNGGLSPKKPLTQEARHADTLPLKPLAAESKALPTGSLAPPSTNLTGTLHTRQEPSIPPLS